MFVADQIYTATLTQVIDFSDGGLRFSFDERFEISQSFIVGRSGGVFDTQKLSEPLMSL